MLRTIPETAFFGGSAPEPTPDQRRRCLYTPWRDVACLLRLCELHPPKRFLEVGCQVGATTLFLSEAMPDTELFACDPGDSILPADRHDVQRGEYLPQHRIGELVAGRPNVTAFKCTFDRMPSIGSFDGIFVDGDHRAEAVLADTERALSMLNPGGFLAWHDCGNPTTPDVQAVLQLLTQPWRGHLARELWHGHLAREPADGQSTGKMPVPQPCHSEHESLDITCVEGTWIAFHVAP